MNPRDESKSRPSARPIASLIGAIIEPVCAKRGFATADLIAAWADIVGPRYASCTQPEKLQWPRRDQASAATARAAQGATLHVRVDAGMAIYLQHEIPVVLERLNGFLGFGAIAQLRIIQAPVASPGSGKAAAAKLSPSAEQAVARTVGEVENDGLREALERLGRGVYSSTR